MCRTVHEIHFANAAAMEQIHSQSVHLVVTSPPYPMIDMWDDLFCQDPETATLLLSENGVGAFASMHRQLDRIWSEVHRVLVPGGIACINIGDATRTLAEEFALYPNHSRILAGMLALGFTNLPNILWRKQTNAPNKFMGSGMMPPGAYVTLEHEYILIFRKGGKRVFTSPDAKAVRRQSAFFWEERNQWFSDVWMDLKGARQDLGDKKVRQRSGAFPFELAYRLISMFSVMGDTVLDPFMGTGTSMFAAVAAGRNSHGYELDRSLASLIQGGCRQVIDLSRQRIAARFDAHRQFVREREQSGKAIKYRSRVYGFPVITRQEIEMAIAVPTEIVNTGDTQWQVRYDVPSASGDGRTTVPSTGAQSSRSSGQLPLFEEP